MVWENWILNFLNVYSLFRNYLLLKIGMIPHSYENEFPSLKDALCQFQMKFLLVVLVKKMNMWNINRGTTVNRWSVKLIFVLSSGDVNMTKLFQNCFYAYDFIKNVPVAFERNVTRKSDTDHQSPTQSYSSFKNNSVFGIGSICFT